MDGQLEGMESFFEDYKRKAKEAEEAALREAEKKWRSLCTVLADSQAPTLTEEANRAKNEGVFQEIDH